jgi:hypothetical protein
VGELLQEETLDCQQVRQAAQRLHDAMERRFACECEIYDEALSKAPWIAPSVRELKDRHNRLRMSFQHFLRSCNADPATLKTKAADLAEQLLEHEASEATLRHEAFPLPSWADDES